MVLSTLTHVFSSSCFLRSPRQRSVVFQYLEVKDDFPLEYRVISQNINIFAGLKGAPFVQNMNPLKAKIPPMKDLTIDNITENTVRINSQSSDARLTYVLERLVTHLHDFTRETRLSTEEWMAALEFLTAVGQICSDVRQVGSIFPKRRLLCSGQEDEQVFGVLQC